MSVPVPGERASTELWFCNRGAVCASGNTANVPAQRGKGAAFACSRARLGSSFRAGASMRVWPGEPSPLGATWDGAGVNFALFSENATRVELCLFDSPGAKAEGRRIGLRENTDQVWHCYL